MSDWTPHEMESVINQIRSKASVDPEFRNLCLSDLNQAVKQLSGKEIPHHFRVDVVEEKSDSDYTLVLPRLISMELSDAALDKVAGGTRGSMKVESGASPVPNLV
jgi:hypothetical protein